MSALTMGGRRMLIARLSGRLGECWIHLRDDGDRAVCGRSGLREASGQEAFGARGTCPDCLADLAVMRADAAAPPAPEKLPCGHSLSAVVSADEGTSYCGECVPAAPPVTETER